MVRQIQEKADSGTIASAERPAAWSREAIRAKLKPASDTVEAMQASLAAVPDLLADTQGQLDLARREWMTKQIAGTAQAIAEAERVMKAHSDTLAFIADFEDALKRQMVILEAETRQARIDGHVHAARASAEAASQAAEAFAEAWRRDYAGAAATIKGLLEMERQAHERLKEARRLVEIARWAGADDGVLPDLVHPTAIAVGRLNFSSQRIGDVVQLPGAFGAPFIPLDSGADAIEVEEQFRDWDAPESDWEHNPGSMNPLRPPLRTRIVKRQVPFCRVTREDTPFWVKRSTPLDGRNYR